MSLHSPGAVETIIASAGTGKTYTLAQRISAAILGGLRPDRLMATTFTKKAASELQARIREELIRQGRADAAAGLLTARMGTVNSVCGAIVSEFSLELGRSAGPGLLRSGGAEPRRQCRSSVTPRTAFRHGRD
jgi:ATP-dependent helicase/nuclease subunit A